MVFVRAYVDGPILIALRSTYGWYGASCESASCECYDNQQCTSGICGACNPGWTGPYCNVRSVACEPTNIPIASSTGDPHFMYAVLLVNGAKLTTLHSSLDGSRFDMQGVGVYWYMRSMVDDFAVQVCQGEPAHRLRT